MVRKDVLCLPGKEICQVSPGPFPLAPTGEPCSSVFELDVGKMGVGVGVGFFFSERWKS